MNNSYRICLFAVLCAAVGSAPAIGRTKKAVTPNILCIHLYNPAAAAPETAEQALSRVTRIFATAGIATIWEQPPADSLEAHVLDLNVSADNSVRSDRRSCLVVEIAPDVPPGAYQGALGFALPFARSGIDVEAIYPRVQLQAKSAGVGAELILAYVIAHEIGHVLLRSSQHAVTGIMRAQWSTESWRIASFGTVAFLPDEAKLMREQLSRFKARSRVEYQQVSPD